MLSSWPGDNERAWRRDRTGKDSRRVRREERKEKWAGEAIESESRTETVHIVPQLTNSLEGNETKLKLIKQFRDRLLPIKHSYHED